jgi:hypothetical protein
MVSLREQRMVRSTMIESAIPLSKYGLGACNYVKEFVERGNGNGENEIGRRIL